MGWLTSMRFAKNKIPGLDALVEISIDHLGVPTIRATSRHDAICALGYMHARDRLFQMDLMRRIAGGRLAEIIGSSAIEIDIAQRSLLLRPLTKKVFNKLPAEQKAILDAYAAGVNAYLKAVRIFPPEFILLNYQPEEWKVEDSVLVYLYKIQMLTSQAEADERMMTVMEAVLPPEVVTFLTPLDDDYRAIILEDGDLSETSDSIPIGELTDLIREQNINEATPGFPFTFSRPSPWGSNGWVVGSSKTHDGRAILANDLHLPLKVPNIYYRVVMRYSENEIAGLVMPGVPIVVSGSNGRVAWGFTNASGDALDLVLLEINPNNPNEYRSYDGWRQFEISQEVIHVRRKPPIMVTVKQTIWGPVMHTRLMGISVAIHWIILDSEAIDFGLANMDQVSSIVDAIDVVHRAGGPPLNMMLADKNGHIGWTLCGKIPLRRGFNGSSSRVWADGYAWDGYVPPEKLPAVINPVEGFLVTANNRTLGRSHPCSVGHNYSSGYRAYRASHQLQQMHTIDEQQLFELQMDTTSEYYRFYQTLILDLLTPQIIADHYELKEIRENIGAWDGKSDKNSRGLALLTNFREEIIEAIISKYLRKCREADPEFRYTYHLDTPIRALLSSRIPSLMPYPEFFSSWEEFIIDVLKRCTAELKSEYNVKTLGDLRWGLVNKASIKHPLGEFLKPLGWWLNMPPAELSGCRFCLRLTRPSYGASVRMVISPGNHSDGLINLPCGQSGDPLSVHYRDLHPFWQNGKSLPYLPGASEYQFVLRPAA